MRVGVLGGTFDPVHIGHLVLAEHARDGLALDTVLFVPAGEPWRKADRAITPPEHRLAMLRLAIEDNDAFGISDIELRRSGPTYTADTLAALAGERLDDEFWFILGADALADVKHWHEPERIAQHAMLAVAPRRGVAPDVASVGVPALADRIVTFDMPPVDPTSTAIRARVASGQSIRYLVPPPVDAYIREHRLYGAG
jgi:nicotinate-nucleotide adenylyltransferase